MNNERKEYTFLWFIENYSYCWHKNGERLVSPEFKADSLENTAWNVQLYPRGQTDGSRGYISLFLNRSKDDTGPENVSVNYELSLLAADESTLFSTEYEFQFKKGPGYGTPRFLQMDEVLSRSKAEYSPQDTLRVRCKIWKGEGNIQPIAQIYARTLIGIEQISFLLVTESFGSLIPNRKETAHIKFPSKKGLALSSSLCLSDDSSGDGNITVEITLSDVNHILSKCKLSLLDVSGKRVECGEVDNRMDTTRKDIRKLPLSLTRKVILNKKNEYLPDDKLSLSCECICSSGVEYEKIEKTVYEKYFVRLNHVSNNDKNEDIYAEQLSACPNALDDFKVIYNDQFLTDVQLKTKTKSFPAHKNILCARSHVFKVMMTNDMKEKNTDCIQIDDLEDDTVQQLLIFLYSDHLENLEWESAIKLYYAGDKYAIEKLKLLSSSFMVKNVSTPTASELLLLADTHNDSYLKNAVENFILKHEEQVFGSDEWRNLIKTNPVLVSETMCLKYMRKI